MTEVVSRTRSRQTGTVVEVVDNRDGSFDCDDPNGWFTVCTNHGGVCSHETRALAVRFAPVPREWCPTCQNDDEGTQQFFFPATVEVVAESESHARELVYEILESENLCPDAAYFVGVQLKEER